MTFFVVKLLSPQSQSLGLEAEANDYVQKPITERELIDRIFSRLERRKI